MFRMGIITQRDAWLKKSKLAGKSSGSRILWIEKAEYSDKAISRCLMWKYKIKCTEIFRTGFRKMQCFNWQKLGYISVHCTIESRCGHCADAHNTRDCLEKPDIRRCNYGKKHATWDQSCPIKIAVKAKAAWN